MERTPPARRGPLTNEHILATRLACCVFMVWERCCDSSSVSTLLQLLLSGLCMRRLHPKLFIRLCLSYMCGGSRRLAVVFVVFGTVNLQAVYVTCKNRRRGGACELVRGCSTQQVCLALRTPLAGFSGCLKVCLQGLPACCYGQPRLCGVVLHYVQGSQAHDEKRSARRAPGLFGKNASLACQT